MPEVIPSSTGDAEVTQRLRPIHVYVIDGDYVWLKNKADTLNAEWEPGSDIDAGMIVSRLISETFNGKGFEFLNSADKAYDANSKAFYFLVMLRQGGQPVVTLPDMEKVKVSWLLAEMAKSDEESVIIKDNFKHFKLLHKRV
ncbi:MAG: hypothetical protein WCI47_02415 [bacterium]